MEESLRARLKDSESERAYAGSGRDLVLVLVLLLILLHPPTPCPPRDRPRTSRHTGAPCHNWSCTVTVCNQHGVRRTRSPQFLSLRLHTTEVNANEGRTVASDRPRPPRFSAIDTSATSHSASLEPQWFQVT